MKAFIALCVLAVASLQVSAYQSGAPEGACGDMVPQHHTEPQKSPSPFAITLNKRTIKPKDKVYVTLSAKPGDSFKGFFIQARVGNTPIGRFDPAEGVKLINCGNGQNTAATHVNAEPKEKVVLAWEAPPNLSENVIFTVTTARDGGTFWVAQTAAPLAVSKS